MSPVQVLPTKVQHHCGYVGWVLSVNQEWKAMKHYRAYLGEIGFKRCKRCTRRRTYQEVWHGLAPAYQLSYVISITGE